MESSVARVQLLWNFLRVISTTLVAAISLLIPLAIPTGWLIPAAPVSILAVVAAILAVTDWKTVWVWVTLFLQASLFTMGLFAVVYGLTGQESVPVLLLTFTMILASEHTLTTTLGYSIQFSNRGNLAVQEFNAEALRVSLNHLYRRLARDNLILSTGFVLSLLAASVGMFVPTAPILSDPSLYIVIASISLAALVVIKEE